MAKISKADGKKLYWYPGEVGAEQLLISELSEQDFPLEIVHVTEKQDCTVTQKFEIRVTKKGGLSMHHMGMNVKQKSVNTPSPASPVLPLKTGGDL